MVPAPTAEEHDMTYKRETAAEIARRIREGQPPVRPTYVSERQPVDGKTITQLDYVR
jgi:hypothetical protein